MNRQELADWYYTVGIESDLDDLHEHCTADLRDKFDLNSADANLLFLVIQGQTNYQHQKYTVAEGAPAPRWTTEDVLEEAKHEGFDGWTRDERLVIEAFLSDLNLAVYESNK